MKLISKTSLKCFLLACFAAFNSSAQDIPDWFRADVSNIENAQSAESADITPRDATVTMIQFGGDPSDVARAVVKAYDSCDSLYESVSAAVQQAPQDANAIAAAIAGLNRCPCSAQGVWARSRVDARVRLEHRDLSFAVRGACTCVVATAEAAASAIDSNAQATALMNSLSTNAGNCGCAESAFVGTANGLDEKADEWIDYLDEQEKQEESKNKPNRPEIIDVIGQVEDSQKQPWIAESGVKLERKLETCDRDVSLYDKFDPTDYYQAGENDRAKCDEEQDELLLSRYIDQPGKYRYASIYNGTDRDIDLAVGGYVMEIYAEGKASPLRVIPLIGIIPQDSSMTVASTQAPGEVREFAQLVTDRLNVDRAADAAVLRRLGSSVGIACPADVYAARTVYQSFPVAVVPDPQILIEGEPRTDETLVDPERGGDLASPN